MTEQRRPTPSPNMPARPSWLRYATATPRRSSAAAAPPDSRRAALLAGSKSDCVVLATPSGLHPQQVIEVAAAGIDVMTEKPMAIRWGDGLRMVRACDDAEVRLFVVKQNRRNRTLQLLKQAVMERPTWS